MNDLVAELIRTIVFYAVEAMKANGAASIGIPYAAIAGQRRERARDPRRPAVHETAELDLRELFASRTER